MFNLYPYTDFHELNVDWIIAQIKNLNSDWNDFKAINSIHFMGDWNITTSYPAWSIVRIAPADGYLSLKPVPAGIDYTNTEYWLHIADYSDLYNDFESRIITLENKTAAIEAYIDKMWFIDVRDFGAKGDGVTDDAAAINAAINSLPQGGVVIVPNGNYLIKSQIHIPLLAGHTQIILYVQGKIIAGADNFTMIDVGGETVDGIVTGNLQIVGLGGTINLNNRIGVTGILLKCQCAVHDINVNRIGDNSIGIHAGVNNTSHRMHLYNLRISGGGSHLNNIGLYTRSPENTYENITISLCKVGVSHHGTGGDYFNYIYVWCYSYVLWDAATYNDTIGFDLYGHLTATFIYTDSCKKHFTGNWDIKINIHEIAVGSYNDGQNVCIVYDQPKRVQVDQARPYSNHSGNKMHTIYIPNRTSTMNIIASNNYKVDMEYEQVFNFTIDVNDLCRSEAVNSNMPTMLWQNSHSIDPANAYLIGYVNRSDAVMLGTRLKGRCELSDFIFMVSTPPKCKKIEEAFEYNHIALYYGAMINVNGEDLLPVYFNYDTAVTYANPNIIDKMIGNSTLYRVIDQYAGVDKTTLTVMPDNP